MTFDKTQRGFEIAEFHDLYGSECSIQQSSAALEFIRNGYEVIPGSTALWIGVHENRMHIDRKMAKEIARILNHWYRTGHAVNP